MAYDSRRNVTVLFGGNDGSFDGETWELGLDNNSGWRLRSTIGPEGRGNHGMAFDGAHGVTILFGGDTGSFEGDTWAWNGEKWTYMSTTGPSPRMGHTMGYDTACGVTTIFGGFDNSLDGETWVFRYTCNGQERMKKAACKDRNGSNQLKVILVGAFEGDSFVITLTDGSKQSGMINAGGRGKAKFNNRPPGDAGTATAEWGCGAVDEENYQCP